MALSFISLNNQKAKLANLLYFAGKDRIILSLVLGTLTIDSLTTVFMISVDILSIIFLFLYLKRISIL